MTTPFFGGECTEEAAERGSTAFPVAPGLFGAQAPGEKGAQRGDPALPSRGRRSGLVEYALIIAVIAIAVIVAMVFLRGQIQNIFSNIGNNLT